jgi:hypothetical protein
LTRLAEHRRGVGDGQANARCWPGENGGSVCLATVEPGGNRMQTCRWRQRCQVVLMCRIALSVRCLH